MGQRLRFFLAQILWVALSFVFLIFNTEFSHLAMILMPMLLVFIINGFLLHWGGESTQRTQQNDNVAIRALVSGFMWLVFVGAVIGGAMELGAIMIPLAGILMIPLLALSSFMWKTEDSTRKAAFVNDTASTEKRKRERVDAMIRDLSDDDLLHLKQRLAYGDIEEENLKYMLSDDGELVTIDERKRRS